MKYKYICNSQDNYISNKIRIINNNDYYKVIALDNIKKDELIIIEYPEINLFGEDNVDRELKILMKYIINNITECIKSLYPRSNQYVQTKLIKSVHKLIKSTSDIKLIKFFNSNLLTLDDIEFYYAKYIYNAFEGYDFGPLTLPNIAKLNHSCNPNCHFTFNKSNGSMYVYSSKNIKKSEEITDSYLENKTIKDHKTYLLDHYGFCCVC